MGVWRVCSKHIFRQGDASREVVRVVCAAPVGSGSLKKAPVWGNIQQLGKTCSDLVKCVEILQKCGVALLTQAAQLAQCAVSWLNVKQAQQHAENAQGLWRDVG